MTFETLLAPARIGTLELRNRILMCPRSGPADDTLARELRAAGRAVTVVGDANPEGWRPVFVPRTRRPR